jgi:hypothetical protein
MGLRSAGASDDRIVADRVQHRDSHGIDMVRQAKGVVLAETTKLAFAAAQ